MTHLRQARDELATDAVRLLTRVAQHSTDSSDGLDFADFLAQVLAATAANVGGPERLLAVRPGSWEASHLHALLRGTVGDEPQSWHRYRTELLLIPLNVAELIESGDSHPGLLGLDEAIDAIGQRYVSAEDDEALDAWDAEIDAVIRRYENEYRTYADRFAAAVQILSKTMTTPVDVRLSADASPTSCWWSGSAITNPNEYGFDPLAVAVWRAAHDAVPLPSVDVRLTTAGAHHAAGEE